MAETILVVGGTGKVGEPVARRMKAEGYAVRILTRDPERGRRKFPSGFELVPGDVDEPSALARALEGCSRVHTSLDGQGDWDIERRGAENIAKIAARTGIKRITHTSGASTCEENAWFPMTRAKLEAENAIRQSGVPFTIFRCTMFMETLLMMVREGRAMVMGRQPNPWRWVAADDYAAMVARAHKTDAAVGKTVYVYGPEPLTMEQALEQYRAACAPEARLTRVPFWMLTMIAAFPGRTELRRIGLPLMRYFSKVKEQGDAAEADALLGKPTTTLAQWCGARETRAT